MADVFQYSVVPEWDLRNLDRRKSLQAQDSYVESLLKPLWSSLLTLIPSSVAANALGLSGLIVNVVSSLLLVWYNPAATVGREIPAWAYSSCGLGLFISQTLNGLGRKQAQRTASVTPLRELFEQLCTSTSSTLITTALGISLQLGDLRPYYSLMVLANNAAIYSHHWRIYVTGKLPSLGFRDGQFAAVLVHLITAALGSEVWSKEVFGFQAKELVSGSLVILPTLAVVYNISIISKGGRGRNGSTIAETSILTPLVPISLYIFGTYWFLQFDDMTDIEAQPALYLLVTGSIYTKMTHKVIVAHLTEGRLILQDYYLAMMCCFYLNWKWGPFVQNDNLFYFFAVYITSSVVSHFVRVCRDFAAYLKIGIFRNDKLHDE